MQSKFTKTNLKLSNGDRRGVQWADPGSAFAFLIRRSKTNQSIPLSQTKTRLHKENSFITFPVCTEKYVRPTAVENKYGNKQKEKKKIRFKRKLSFFFNTSVGSLTIKIPRDPTHVTRPGTVNSPGPAMLNCEVCSL